MRIGGLVLWLLLAIPALLAVPAILVYLLFVAREEVPKAKDALRCMDELVNAAWFGGSAYESLSSHAWRERGKWWARAIIWLTDLLQRGHCEEANRREQPIMDFVNKEKDYG